MNQHFLYGIAFMNIVKTFVYAFLFGAFLLTNTASFAAAPTPGDAQPDIVKIEDQDYFLIFRKLFFSTTYNSLKCQENVYRLLKEIQAKHKNIGDVEVIFIFDKYHYKILHPEPSQMEDQSINRPLITLYKTRIVPTRDMPPNTFRYHVVASINGCIFDFDYSDSPVVLPANEYFKNMFTPDFFSKRQRDSLFNRLTIRIIPVEEYLNQHPRHPSYYLYDLSEKYPASSVNNYLKSILFSLDNLH